VLKMQAAGTQVVHFDLKDEHVIYHDAKGLPIITGFGAAFQMSELEPADAESLRRVFFAYADQYSPWCVDVALLAYIASRVLSGAEPTKGMDESLCEKDVSKNNRAFSEGIFSPEQLASFDARTAEYASSLANKTWREVVAALLSEWRTWDVYSLCVVYRRAMAQVFGSTMAQQGAPDQKKSSSFWVSGYVALLERALLAPPAAFKGAARATPEEMRAAIAAGATETAPSDAIFAQ
jgi:hypothetical protein